MVRNTMNVPRSLFIGFEPILNELERIHSAGRSQDNYPPHNVVKVDVLSCTRHVCVGTGSGVSAANGYDKSLEALLVRPWNK